MSNNSVLVGKKAPNFIANTVMPNNNIKSDFELNTYLNGDVGVVFFYPLDFTFVCPTEIIAFNHRLGDFSSRQVKVVAISVDSHFSHLAWKETPVNNGGIGNVQMPLVSDLNKSISKEYGVLFDDNIALRASFLIDKKGIVRHQVVNDFPLGRNVDEMLRMVDALAHFEEFGEVCPAGWNKGQDAMKANSEGVADYLTSNADKL
jgi:peroxiredoxin (alkyl hydroperoxide reductase subunit C)